MSNNGFITLHRSILEWEWWGDQNVTRLFIYLMLRANHKKGRLRGVDINRGQTAVCYKTISNDTGLSYKQVRAAIDKLCLTGEVSKKRAPKGHTFGNGIFQIIQINNYDKYQDKGTTRADFGQTLGRPWAPNNKKNKGTKEQEYLEGASEKPPKKRNKFSIDKPEDISQQVWDDFIAIRRQKKAPYTNTAHNRNIAQAEKAGITINEALAFTCHKGWQSFTADYYKNATQKEDEPTW